MSELEPNLGSGSDSASPSKKNELEYGRFSQKINNMRDRAERAITPR